MTEKKTLTLEFVAGVLRKKKLLSEADEKEIAIRGEAQRARLRKTQDSFYSSRRLQTINEPVSQAEVIASLEFHIPGSEKYLTEDAITEAIASEVGLPYRKIDPLKLNLDIVTSHIPRPFAQRYLVVPIEEKGGVVTLAVADPFNLEAVENLKSTLKMRLELVLSSKSDILKLVREFYGFRYSVNAAQKESGGVSDLGNLEQYVRLKGSVELEATDQHIVNAVEYLLHYAYDQRASDIHIEPKRDRSLVRLRIDGVLHYIHTIPKAVHPSIVSRIKMLSRMDIAEKRKPQDGRIKTAFRDREIELSVSTLPTAFGEKIVIRIFDPELLFQDIAVPEEDERHSARDRPHRLRQDHDALFGPEVALVARGEHRHHRRPHRDDSRGVQPGRGPALDRGRLRREPPDHIETGPGYNNGRRDKGQGDGR